MTLHFTPLNSTVVVNDNCIEGEVEYSHNDFPFQETIYYKLYRNHRRYLVLDKDAKVLLMYKFDKDNYDPTNNGNVLTKEIQIEGNQFKHWGTGVVKKPKAFVVKDGKDFYTFNCQNHEDKNCWVEHLRSVVAEVQKDKKKSKRNGNSIRNPLVVDYSAGGPLRKSLNDDPRSSLPALGYPLGRRSLRCLVLSLALGLSQHRLLSSEKHVGLALLR